MSILNSQYYKNYRHRLAAIRPIILNNIENNTDKYSFPIISSLAEINTTNIHGNSEQSNNNFIFVGVLFIAATKPSVFFELKKINNSFEVYTNKIYYVEDEHTKVEVIFEENYHEILCTGMVLGFIASESENGIIKVKDIIFPGFIKKIENAQKEIENESNTQEMVDETKGCTNKIAFLCNPVIKQNYKFNLGLIIDFLNGVVDNKNKVEKIMICGNIFSFNKNRENSFLSIESNNTDNFLEETLNNLALVTGENDNLIILPSIHDPTDNLYPLEPMNKKLFKGKSIMNNEFLPSPAYYEFKGKNILVMNKDIVLDILKYEGHDDSKEAPLEEHLIRSNYISNDGSPNLEKKENHSFIFTAMNLILKIRHLIPTSPDTLPCKPDNEDSLIITKFIDYFIITGISHQKKISENKKTVFITVPEFNCENTAVILNVLNSDIELFKIE
ncbi:DNA polymerase delta regulatory subunit [Spraguea lophii 42_110]|uniref:DNA polymerase delta regulatory subunit n=1 Tax=Spraguea lophii (strain 42_110) TaxID=1358809 RepID=S7XSB9_SPRLO|nr:DNA polymerase delta regulatory subunit [Spraguea lophii 42_110]